MLRKLSPALIIAIIIGLLIVPFAGVSGYVIRLLAMIFFWIGKTGCWNIISGYTGYIDFGAVGYYGIGSYVTALLSKSESKYPDRLWIRLGRGQLQEKPWSVKILKELSKVPKG